MALTSAQQTEMTELERQVADMKQIVMNSPQCTMAGMGNYFFEAFKNIEKQIEKVKNA